MPRSPNDDVDDEIQIISASIKSDAFHSLPKLNDGVLILGFTGRYLPTF